MAQKRRNIEDIASVLVRKLNELEKNIGQLENVEFEAPNVDYREFYKIINHAKEEIESDFLGLNRLFEKQLELEERQLKSQKSFLSDLSDFYKVRHSRVPNWIFGLICALFLMLGGVLWKFSEDYKRLGVLEKENRQLYELYQKHQEN